MNNLYKTEQVNNSQNVACPVGPKTETLVQATLDDWITGYYVCIFNEVRRPLASTPLGAKKVQCFDLILLNHHLMFQFLFSSEFNILCNLSRACSSLNWLDQVCSNTYNYSILMYRNDLILMDNTIIQSIESNH